MAFQSVRTPSATKDAVKLSEVDIGEEVLGYAIAIRESQQYPGSYSILMQDLDGERFYVNATGTVKYDIEDERIKMGLLTKIIRREDRKSKNGRIIKQFDVLQDPERTVDDTSFDKIPSSREIDNESVRRAAEKAAVKAQAEKMSAAMKSKRGR